MDAARTCVRLGCNESVTVTYRRSQNKCQHCCLNTKLVLKAFNSMVRFSSRRRGKDKVEGFKYEVMALNEDGAGIHGTEKVPSYACR